MRVLGTYDPHQDPRWVFGTWASRRQHATYRNPSGLKISNEKYGNQFRIVPSSRASVRLSVYRAISPPLTQSKRGQKKEKFLAGRSVPSLTSRCSTVQYCICCGSTAQGAFTGSNQRLWLLSSCCWEGRRHVGVYAGNNAFHRRKGRPHGRTLPKEGMRPRNRSASSWVI